MKVFLMTHSQVVSLAATALFCGASSIVVHCDSSVVSTLPSSSNVLALPTTEGGRPANSATSTPKE